MSDWKLKSPPGLGAEDLEQDTGPPDFERGAGGEPIVSAADGSGKRERYARCSSLGGTLDETSGLNNWLVAKAVEGAAKDQSILARAIAASPYEDNKSAWTKLRQDAIQAGRGAYKADVGTAVHAMSDRFEQEPEYDPGGAYTPALEAYVAEMERLGLKSQLFECKLVNDDLRVAGSADRLIEATKPLVAPDGSTIAVGELLIGDLKTGASLEYSIAGYAVQLSAYAGATLYDVVLNERMPTPTINQKWAIIFHMNVEEATCEMLWVDLEVGQFGAALANEVREWRRNWRRKAGYKASVLPVLVADSAPPVEVESEVVEPPEADVPDRDQPADSDLEGWRTYAKDRLVAIKAHPEASQWTLLRWPEGTKVPKALDTIEEARILNAFLDKVEAEFGMSFVAGEPTERKQKGSAA